MNALLSSGLAAMALLLVVVLSGPGAAADTPREPVRLLLLSVSDWHAQLDPLLVAGDDGRITKLP